MKEQERDKSEPTGKTLELTGLVVTLFLFVWWVYAGITGTGPEIAHGEALRQLDGNVRMVFFLILKLFCIAWLIYMIYRSVKKR